MPPTLLFILIIGEVLWLWTLISHLKRKSISDTDRIVWTIVLCTLNLLGMLLYWFMEPPGEFSARSEKELKDFLNARAFQSQAGKSEQG